MKAIWNWAIRSAAEDRDLPLSKCYHQGLFLTLFRMCPITVISAVMGCEESKADLRQTLIVVMWAYTEDWFVEQIVSTVETQPIHL